MHVLRRSVETAAESVLCKVGLTAQNYRSRSLGVYDEADLGQFATNSCFSNEVVAAKNSKGGKRKLAAGAKSHRSAVNFWHYRNSKH
jgi:hypothetical protein